MSSQTLPAGTAKVPEVLADPDARRAYAETMADTLDAISRAATDLAHKLRTNPNEVLAQPFRPALIGMDPNARAMFEVSYYDRDDAPHAVVFKGKAIVGTSLADEVGFRAVCCDGKVTPTRNNSYGA